MIFKEKRKKLVTPYILNAAVTAFCGNKIIALISHCER